jgi:Xaa-Pro aminopeptidase
MTPIPYNAFVLVDAAPEWHGYASDLTRTYARSTTSEMNVIHRIVAKSQQAGLDNYQIGTTWKRVCELVFDSLTESLREFKLLIGDFKMLKNANVVKLFMPHSVGHPVGLGIYI